METVYHYDDYFLLFRQRFTRTRCRLVLPIQYLKPWKTEIVELDSLFSNSHLDSILWDYIIIWPEKWNNVPHLHSGALGSNGLLTLAKSLRKTVFRWTSGTESNNILPSLLSSDDGGGEWLDWVERPRGSFETMVDGWLARVRSSSSTSPGFVRSWRDLLWGGPDDPAVSDRLR